MRLTTALLIAIPALASAAQEPQQIPLADTLNRWFEKAKSYLPAVGTAPIAATTTAAKKAAAGINIHTVSDENWDSLLSPSSSSPQTWMIFVSGGNKTCYGQCTELESVWNETAAIFATTGLAKAPKLGYINCETTPLLCSILHASPPSLWYIQLPAKAEEKTTIRIIGLNNTKTVVNDNDEEERSQGTTARDIVRIHTQKKYEETDVYDGIFHPFDSNLAKYGLTKPVGYVLYAFGLVPSWLVMIVVSFASRNLM